MIPAPDTPLASLLSQALGLAIRLEPFAAAIEEKLALGVRVGPEELEIWHALNSATDRIADAVHNGLVLAQQGAVEQRVVVEHDARLLDFARPMGAAERLTREAFATVSMREIL